MWQSQITFAVAVLGAVLGVINTWQTIRRDRLRLKVRPITAISQHWVGYGIEIVNLSQFPVTIVEAGFTLGSKWATAGNRLVITQPQIIDGGSWPRRLESRSGVTVYFDVVGWRPHTDIGRAFVKTSCGEIAYGWTDAVSGLREALARSPAS